MEVPEIPDLLVDTLDNLTEKELKRFRWFLKHNNREGCRPIPAGSLEKDDSTDIIDTMIDFYGRQKALEVTPCILRKMNRNDLAENLEKKMEETQAIREKPKRKRSPSPKTGEPVAMVPWSRSVHSPLSEESVSSSISAHCEVAISPPSTSNTCNTTESLFSSSDETIMKKISERNRKRLKSTENLSEGTEKNPKKNISDFYIELYVTDGVSDEVKTQHEVQQIEVQSQREQTTQSAISCNDIFKLGEPRTVMTKGIAGIGKSVAVKKFILDWRKGEANQDVDLIFTLPFRELNLYMDDQYSLYGLILEFHPELRLAPPDVEFFDKAKIIFIFDGLDESKFHLNFSKKGTLSHIMDTSSVDMLIVNLLKENLLPSASIWITSRPAAAHQIPYQYIDRWTEIHGFRDEQKEQYFRNKIKDQTEAEEIVKQIRKSRSLYIMCRIPVFCWIIATVFLSMEIKDKREIPQTLTEIFAHFLLIQLTRKEQKDTDEGQGEDITQVLKANKDIILKLAELAYRELEKNNILFSEDDLKECRIDIHQDLDKSGMCTKLVAKEHLLHKRKVYCFVHLSIQEFLAALFVFYSFSTGKLEVLKSFDMKGRQLNDLLESAVKKSLQSKNGHLDLFLRFLLGLSLESNQKLFEGLLTHTQENSVNVKMMVQYVKDAINRNSKSTERCMNLLLCLLELKDRSLHEEVERYGNTGELLSPALCSVLAYIKLVSEKTQDEFDLMKYNTTDKGRVRLVIAVRNCKTGRLVGCGLNKDTCQTISSALQSENSPLKNLNLSCNDLRDAGIQVLTEGLSHKNCNLEILRLSSCNLTGTSCKTLASVLQSSESQLRELDLTNNNLAAGGVQELSPALSQPHCKLHTLILARCNLTVESCRPLAAALQSSNVQLTHLDLTNNDLGKPGLDNLSEALSHQNCKLEILKLSGCLVSERACNILASVLTSKSSSLKELDLSYNHTGDSGVRLRSNLKDKGCLVNIDHNAERWMRPGLQKYACELTLDVNTAHPELVLSENNRKVTRVEEDQLYPDGPERFDCCPQLLCQEGLTGRHYWEAEWSGKEAVIGVAYQSIRRKAYGAECKLGLNKTSYGLWCEGGNYSVRYNLNKTAVSVPTSGCNHVGLYLDWPAGTLSFYAVSAGKLVHLHTFHSTVGEPPSPGFSEPLYPGFWLHWDTTASIRQVT